MKLQHLLADLIETGLRWVLWFCVGNWTLCLVTRTNFYALPLAHVISTNYHLYSGLMSIGHLLEVKKWTCCSLQKTSSLALLTATEGKSFPCSQPTIVLALEENAYLHSVYICACVPLILHNSLVLFILKLTWKSILSSKVTELPQFGENKKLGREENHYQSLYWKHGFGVSSRVV